jgi:hypothetical protein
MMERYVFFLLVSVVTVFTSCTGGTISTSGSQEEKTAEEIWEIIQKDLAPGAEVSKERPFSDVLSEQEVLLKAVDYAGKIGAGDPSYYLYQEIPALLTAKIETPILLHFVPTGTTSSYLLTAVDTDGTMLMSVWVNSSPDADMDSFELLRAFGLVNMPEHSTHHITKREAIHLSKRQFPDKQVSDPIAVLGLHLEDSPHSGNHAFWYFTVSDTSQSVSDMPEEYIISSIIDGWKNISGGLSNLSAISSGAGGSPHLKWNRMAKLETPLRIFERIEAARNDGGAAEFTPDPVTKVKYTPIPLQ